MKLPPRLKPTRSTQLPDDPICSHCGRQLEAGEEPEFEMIMVVGKPTCIDSVRCRWNAVGCPEVTDTPTQGYFRVQWDMFVIRHLEGTLLPWGTFPSW